jgi:hypothetical protein
MLTDTQNEIIRVFAESGMNRTEAARRLFVHYNTVYYQLIRIMDKTGLNPWDFFDLHELLRMAGVADCVDVVRCGECKHSSKFGPSLACRRNPVAVAVNGCDFCSYGEKED